MKVEVELEDLESLVFATAAIKQIETSLAARRQDPFVRPHLVLTEAHDKLVFAMNSARRSTAADTKIGWDDPLTKEELEQLTDISLTIAKGNDYKIQGDARLPKKDGSMSDIDSLASKGCIRIGQGIVGVVWPGEKQPSIKPIPIFLIETTQRGKDKLEAVRAA